MQKERQEFRAREEELSHYVILLQSKLHKEQITRAMLEERIKIVSTKIITLIENASHTSYLTNKKILTVLCSNQGSNKA